MRVGAVRERGEWADERVERIGLMDLDGRSWKTVRRVPGSIQEAYERPEERDG